MASRQPPSSEDIFKYQNYLQGLGKKRPGMEAAFDPQIIDLSIQAPNLEDLYNEYAPESSYWLTQPGTPENLIAQFVREGKSMSFIEREVKKLEDKGVLDIDSWEDTYKGLTTTFGKEERAVKTQQKKQDPLYGTGLPSPDEDYDARTLPEFKTIENNVRARVREKTKNINPASYGYYDKKEWETVIKGIEDREIENAAKAYSSGLRERGRTPFNDEVLRREYTKATKGYGK